MSCQNLMLQLGLIARARDWIEHFNQPETAAELKALRRSVARSQPFGSAAWQEPTAERLGLQSTVRARAGQGS
jgi:hypothetical protein